MSFRIQLKIGSLFDEQAGEYPVAQVAGNTDSGFAPCIAGKRISACLFEYPHGPGIRRPRGNDQGRVAKAVRGVDNFLLWCKRHETCGAPGCGGQHERPVSRIGDGAGIRVSRKKTFDGRGLSA